MHNVNKAIVMILTWLQSINVCSVYFLYKLKYVRRAIFNFPVHRNGCFHLLLISSCEKQRDDYKLWMCNYIEANYHQKSGSAVRWGKRGSRYVIILIKGTEEYHETFRLTLPVKWSKLQVGSFRIRIHSAKYFMVVIGLCSRSYWWWRKWIENDVNN